MPPIWSNIQTFNLDKTEPTLTFINSNSAWLSGTNQQWPVVPLGLGGSTHAGGVLGYENISSALTPFDTTGVTSTAAFVRISCVCGNNFDPSAPNVSFTVNISLFDGTTLTQTTSATLNSIESGFGQQYFSVNLPNTTFLTNPDDFNMYVWVVKNSTGNVAVSNLSVTITVEVFGGLDNAETFSFTIPSLAYEGRPGLIVQGYASFGFDITTIGGTFTPFGGETEPLHNNSVTSASSSLGGIILASASPNLTRGGILNYHFTNPVPYQDTEFTFGAMLIDHLSLEFQAITAMNEPSGGSSFTKGIDNPDYYEVYSSYGYGRDTLSTTGRVTNTLPASAFLISSEQIPWSFNFVDRTYNPQSGVIFLTGTVNGVNVHLPSDGTEVVILPPSFIDPGTSVATFSFSVSNTGPYTVRFASLDLFIRDGLGNIIEYVPIGFTPTGVVGIGLANAITITNPDTSIAYQMTARITALLPEGIVSPYITNSEINFSHQSERESWQCGASILQYVGPSSGASITLIGSGTLFLTQLSVGQYIRITDNQFASGNNIPAVREYRTITNIIDNTHLTVDIPLTHLYSPVFSSISIPPSDQLPPPEFDGLDSLNNPQQWTTYDSGSGVTSAIAFGFCLGLNQTGEALPIVNGLFSKPYIHIPASFSIPETTFAYSSVLFEQFPQSNSCFVTGGGANFFSSIPGGVNPDETAGWDTRGFPLLPYGTGNQFTHTVIVGTGIDPTLTVIKVIVGLSTLFLISDGTVYSSGGGVYYGYTNPGTLGSIDRPTIIPGLTGIVDIDCVTTAVSTGNYGLALDNLGNLWAWGTGIPTSAGVVTSVTPIISSTGIAALTKGGKYIVDIFGQCLVSSSTGWIPFFAFPAKVIDALAIKLGFTQITSLFVLENGQLLGMGNGSTYALGATIALSGIAPTIPTPIPDFGSSVAEVISNGTTTWARTYDGKMLLMGRYNNVFGEKGDGTFGPGAFVTQTMPSQVIFPEAVACGKLSRFNASACIGTDGQIYVWGSNNYGAFGIGTVDTDPHPFPQAIPNTISASQICALMDGSTGFPTGPLLKAVMYCGGTLTPSILPPPPRSTQVIG